MMLYRAFSSTKFPIYANKIRMEKAWWI